MKKVSKQAMNVSIHELRRLADKLESEDIMSEFPTKDIYKKWSIPIINNQTECSDTWQLEDD